MSDQGVPTTNSDIESVLLQRELISPSQLQSAQTQAAQNGKSVLETLIELEMIGVEDITRTKAQMAEIPYINFNDLHVDPAVLITVEAQVARANQMLPIAKRSDGTLRLAVSAWNRTVMAAATTVSTKNKARIAPVMVNETKLREAIETYYFPTKATTTREVKGFPHSNSAMPVIVGDVKPSAPASWTPPAVTTPMPRPTATLNATLPTSVSNSGLSLPDNIEDISTDQPVIIQTVNQVLAQAINRGASDIHFEPWRDRLDIRFRIDGSLHFVDTVRDEYKAAVISRVKIMADLNIAERRVPQDGRISVMMNGRTVDIRVSSLPTQYGESIVLRVLDKGTTRPTLDQLGFSEKNLRILNSIIRKPHGIILATGPTGSGKTTTLYSAIETIHTPDINIMTVEDPVEYDLDGIRQSNVSEKQGLTFARQLRAILRQDPDVIYVGEIRDNETADVAFRAALTGHLVFSTLHCNDAAGAYTRLLNMDMDPFLVASTVIGVMAQRLVRRVCLNCARPYTPTPVELSAFEVDTASQEYKHAHFQMGAGCEDCDHTGYRGRFSVQELMVMNDNIRQLILQRAPSNKIRQEAINFGMVSMRQDAAQKVMLGITTFEEAQKRVFVEDVYEDLPAAY